MLASQICFATSDYTISSGTLSVGGCIALNSDVTASITSDIIGSHGPQICGDGRLTLGGDNSGNTIVFGGTVVLDNEVALGSGVAVMTGATVDLNGLSPTIDNVGSGSGTITNGAASSTSALTVLSGGSYGGVLEDGPAGGEVALTLARERRPSPARTATAARRPSTPTPRCKSVTAVGRVRSAPAT